MLAAMKSQPFAEIRARVLEAAAREPGGAVAFDGDGTLWSGDVGEDFFHAMLDKGRFEPPAEGELRRTAHEHGLSDKGTGGAIARHLYEEYRHKRYPEERICELMAWGCAGWSQAEVDGFARDVVTRGGLSARLHEEALAVLAWAREQGIEVFVVSASPRAVVLEATKAVGVEPSHVLAATPTYDDRGIMLASIERPIPYGQGKVTRLRERIGPRVLYAAFGDNVFDIPMLREARVAVAVRPKERLEERAHEVPGLVELARGS
jgi:HAD superfamily phosphoserine phosphatase-like hydrolase